MKYYSMWTTKMPAPAKGPPYPKDYITSWSHAGDLYTTHAHMMQIATCLKRHAREYYGIRVFEGKDLGKLIWTWTFPSRDS